jgi:hypothetical protein
VGFLHQCVRRPLCSGNRTLRERLGILFSRLRPDERALYGIELAGQSYRGSKAGEFKRRQLQTGSRCVQTGRANMAPWLNALVGGWERRLTGAIRSFASGAAAANGKFHSVERNGPAGSPAPLYKLHSGLSAHAYRTKAGAATELDQADCPQDGLTAMGVGR